MLRGRLHFRRLIEERTCDYAKSISPKSLFGTANESGIRFGVGRIGGSALLAFLPHELGHGICGELVKDGTIDALCRRKIASLETLRHRVKARQSCALQQEFAARVAELNSILDRARLEDFTVANENRPLNEVAIEVLLKAGWISN